MRRLPVRWRLTAWYAALFACLLAVLGAALFFGLRARLYGTFDDQLRAQAATTLATVQSTGGKLALSTDENADPTSGEHFVRLIDRTGAVVADTGPALGGIPLDPALVDAARAGQTLLTSFSVDGDTLRVITTPVWSGGGVVGVLQVGMFRGNVDRAVAAVLGALGVAMPILLIVVAASGYFLVGRALAPVAALTRQAASIGRDDLRSRVNLPLPDDELGRLARTFDAMLDRIEDAFVRQQRFTGDAAHELRTPISLMLGQVDLALARRRSAAGYREALREFRRDLTRLNEVVGALLTLAQSDTGLPIVRVPFDLAQTVDVVAEQYRGLAERAGIVLRVDASSAHLEGDEDLFVRVLVNLLDNALAHTPSGGVITVGCRSEGACVRMWVEDTGVGIAPEHQARVFDRFYRVDSGRARRHGGAGLGLGICRAIVEAHGGTIGLTSAVGQGTRVEAVLPRAGGHAEGERR